jgi:hypothetical protein
LIAEIIVVNLQNIGEGREPTEDVLVCQKDRLANESKLKKCITKLRSNAVKPINNPEFNEWLLEEYCLRFLGAFGVDNEPGYYYHHDSTLGPMLIVGEKIRKATEDDLAMKMQDYIVKEEDVVKIDFHYHAEKELNYQIDILFNDKKRTRLEFDGKTIFDALKSAVEALA